MITKIYTDGSALDNANKDNRRCGSGTYLALYDTKTKKQKPVMYKGTYLGDNTNNYAELYAVREAFKWLYKSKQLDKLLPLNVEMFIDSKYVLGIITGATTYKQNIELIDKILWYQKEISKIGYKINYNHIKAHTRLEDVDSQGNDLVDKLAKRCAKDQRNYYHSYVV